MRSAVPVCTGPVNVTLELIRKYIMIESKSTRRVEHRRAGPSPAPASREPSVPSNTMLEWIAEE